MAQYLSFATRTLSDAAERRSLHRERYEAVFNQSSNFIAILEGAEQRFVFANDNYLRAVGGRHVVGRTVREALPDAVTQGLLAKLDQVYDSSRAMQLTNAHYDLEPVSGGPVTHLLLNVFFQPVTDASGRACGILIEGNVIEEPVAVTD